MLSRVLTAFVVLAAALRLAVPAYAEEPLALVDAGKLTWGSAVTFPPFEFIDSGKPAGFDIDLVAGLTAKMKLQSAILPMEFKGLIPALNGGRIDAIVSGMYINPERSQVVDFIPYLRVGNQLLVTKGNPLHIVNKPDLCGRRITAPVATVYESSAKQIAVDCKTAGKPEPSILTLSSTAVCSLALKEGRADALIASVPTVVTLIRESPDAFEATGETFDNNTELGIGVRKNQPATKAAMDEALKAMVADGSYAALVKKYALPASSSLF